MPEIEWAVVGAAKEMADAAFAAAAAVRDFGRTYQGFAEREYLAHHDRLPGSTRTRRLRKKRRTRVCRWLDTETTP